VFGALPDGALALLAGTDHDLRAGDAASAIGARASGLTLSYSAIARVTGLIPRERRPIAVACGLITPRRGGDTRPRALLVLKALIAHVTPGL
jgi:hypothetical protein